MMDDPRRSGQESERLKSGLCATCLHAQIVVTSRGSRFVLCRVSTVDPRYPRYPHLPVLRCAAHASIEQA